MHESTATTHDGGTDSNQHGTGSTAGAENRKATRRGLLRATAGAIALGSAAGTAAGRPIPDVAEDRRQDTRDVMFTSCARDGAVTLIDAHSLETYGTVDVYPDPGSEDPASDVVDDVEPNIINSFARQNYLEHANVSPDGRTLYAARGHAGDVTAVNIATGEKLWETELEGARADHQVISTDGRYLFTSDLSTDHIDKIDTRTGTIVGRAPARDLPHGNHYHELPAFGGNPMLVNGSLGNMVADDSQTGDPMQHQLSFIDPETMLPLRRVDFEEGVRPIAITGDGRKVYVQISYFHGFHEYDVVTDEVTRTMELPKTDAVPESESDYPLQSAHHGIGLSSDDEYIAVAGTTSNVVFIVRRSDLTLLETIDVGVHPYWVQTGPTGDRAFVPVRGENEVITIDYESQTVIGRTETDRQPHVTEYSEVPTEVLEELEKRQS